MAPWPIGDLTGDQPHINHTVGVHPPHTHVL
jgi:hypothetical protein